MDIVFKKTHLLTSEQAIPGPDYRLKYDGNGKLEWVDVNALTAVVGDVIDSLDNLGDVYYDNQKNLFIGDTPNNLSTSSNPLPQRNIGIGDVTLVNTTSGKDNTAVGDGAMANNTEGTYNVAIGKQALASNVDGNGNAAIGRFSLISNTEGYGNVAVGQEASYSNTKGDLNVAIGRQSLKENTEGHANVAIGSDAGRGIGVNSNQTSSYSVYLGANAKPGVNNLIIR